MTKIHIFSGFLGAGKTTLIKKLIAESYAGEKLVLIENEFGEIGIDGGFLQDAGVAVTEMNSGCICCSLVGDFGKALAQVLETYHPDRILIEPSGVGKLSDVIRAVQNVQVDDAVLEGSVTVVDAKKCKMYQKNFGEFWGNQIENADCIILSHTKGLSPEKLKDAADRVRAMNNKAVLITTDWEELTGNQILAAINRADTLSSELEKLKEETCEHHHHHHEEGEECCCGHHHDHDHDHEHHHHHADDIFTSWGRETTRVYSEEEISSALSELENEEKFGFILRAKGIVPCTDGTWIHFDYVPGTPDIRRGSAGTTGRLCVIGSKINEEKIAEIFMA
ncbi:MAG: GTP-binding protein [Oscillospiraceae bacterium]|nr:GTP-binding protein [Oscillospiraceae bacterium]